MDDSTNTDPTAVTSTPIPVPAAVTTAQQTLLDHLKQAGQDELHAAKPLIGQIVRQFVQTYESHLTGIAGLIARPMINAMLDAIFGPAQTA